MAKQRHPGVDQDLLAQMEKHDRLAKAGFAQHTSVTDAIKADIEDSIPVDGSLTYKPSQNDSHEDFNQPMEKPVDDDMSEEESNDPPSDPKERFDWVIKQMETNFQSHPDKDQMKMWKNAHSEIFVCNFGDKLFVYRYLKRIEWTTMQNSSRMEEMTQNQLEHLFIEKCLLYPTPTSELLYNMPAGLVGMLFQQIQMNSGFMDPQFLSQFTVKL